MKSIEIISYHSTHEMGIKALCRIPVSGDISLTLEREPNYYAGACIQTEEPEIYVCTRIVDGLVCGVFNIGFRRLFYQGKIVKVRYLCDLRIHPDYQKSTLLYRIVKFVNQFELVANGLPAQTVVFADNLKMVQMINSRAKKNMDAPFYHHAGILVTNMLTLKRQVKMPDNIETRTATARDMPMMQDFWFAEASKLNYFPFYDFTELGKPYYYGLSCHNFYLAFQGQALVGICGTWNQKDIKQTRIKGYSRAFQFAKPFYNLYAGIMGKPKLPNAGSIANYLGLHSILIKNREPAIFAALLSAITAAAKDGNYEYLLFALAKNDPLQKFMDHLPNKRQIVGNYYLVNNGEKLPDDLLKSWFYLETTRI